MPAPTPSRLRRSSTVTSSIGAALVAGGLLALPVGAFGGAVALAAPGDVCSTSSIGWTGDELLVPWNQVKNTGVVVPAPAPGETVTLLSAAYETYDRYPDGSSPSRAHVNQANERVGITVGGVAVGGLSVDVPDSVAEGALTDWDSGPVNGTFGGAGTVLAGGEIVIRHASLYGFVESPNSVRVSQVVLTVERCRPPDPTTPTTAAPTTAAPTTTEVGSGGPTTTSPGAGSTTTTVGPGGSTTTTLVGSGGPTTTTPGAVTTTTAVGSGGPTTTTPGAVTTTTAVGSGGPTTTAPGGSLPTTGTDNDLVVSLALVAALSGATLLLLGRRPARR
jgi:LPXTG-motif cell wall-anchored protein